MIRGMATSCYITFKTVHQAMQVEKILKSAGFSFRMVPVPRQISSDCGMGLKYECTDEGGIKETLNRYQVNVAGFHRLEEGNKSLMQFLFSRQDKSYKI